MTLCLDTSALAKRYIGETGSAWVVSLCGSTQNVIAVSGLAYVELFSAIARKEATGEISASTAQTARTNFITNSVEYFWVEVDPLLSTAASLTQPHGLRALDAIWLATALTLHTRAAGAGQPSPTFVSADANLLLAAAAEGLQADNPLLHP